jgi:hypothetical protein
VQIDRDIKDIPLNDIDEIEWLKIRQMEDRDAEHDDLTYLGLSIATRTATPADPSSADDPTSWEDFLLRMSVGQLAPVRVIRYPPEVQLSLPKPYGLVFGYRRWHAAKQRGLTTIKAQVIHLSIEEYRDNKTKFFLLLMGFTENAEREPLTGTDYLKAVRRLKDKYEAIYPKSSNRFKHLTQDRSTKGHFASTNGQKPPNFNKVLRKITKKSQRRIEEDIQIADLLTSAMLDDRYKEPINKSVALLLAKISHEQQIAILDRLATQHLPFTIKNIESAINQCQRQSIGTPNTNDRKRTVNAESALTADPNDSNDLAGIVHPPSRNTVHVPPHSALPDLTLAKTAIKLCLDLRHRFSWTPSAIKEALPIFGDLMSASQALADYLRHEQAILDGHISRTPSTSTAHGSNGDSKHVLKHVER